MNFSKYQYVVTLAKTRSISKAAAELYMSQPALTKFINKLEDELGVKLFNRTTIPISLTYAGECFATEAEKIIEIQNNLDKEMEDLSQMKKGRLTIGVTASRGEGWLPFILPAFKKKYPNIEVKIIEGSYTFLESQLMKGLADILLFATPVDSENVDYQTLSKEEVFLIASEKHPLLQGKDLSKNSPYNPVFINPQSLINQDMIAMFNGTGMRRIVNSIFDTYNFNCHITIETQSVDTAYKLAAANLGMTFVTEGLITAHFPSWLPIICKISETPIIRENIVCYKKGTYMSKAGIDFIELLYELFHSQCPKFGMPSQDEFQSARLHMAESCRLQNWINQI